MDLVLDCYIFYELQIQNLEREIEEKRNQMRVLEQRIIDSKEASIANASLVDMQQVCLFFCVSICYISIYTKAYVIWPLEILLVHFYYFAQQTVTRLMAQCNEKGFELEVIMFSFFHVDSERL